MKKIYLLKDANGNYFGYERGHDNRSFSPENSIILTWSEKEKAWAEEWAEIFNRGPFESVHALPITIVEIEIP